MTALLDHRFGVVRALDPRPTPAHFPPSYDLVQARIADTSRFSPWHADASGAGHAFGDPVRAREAALGEAVERYAGNLVPPGLRTASWRTLQDDGVAAVRPSSLALFSGDQLATPGFPAAPLTDDTVVAWARGRRLVDDVPVLVPASLVWPSWFAGRPPAPDNPLAHPVIQAGLAAGPDTAWAVRSALAEVVERDAMTLCWEGGLGLRRVRVPGWLSGFARGPRDALDVSFWCLTTEVEVPVLAALVHDRTTGYLTMGTGVGTDPDTTAVKAYGEALQLQLFVAEHDDPDSALCRTALLATSPLKPWRADRRYGDSYRADGADATDHACHLQLHLDPAVQRRFRAELDLLTVGDVDLDACRPAAGALDRLPRTLHDLGHSPVVVDVTTSDVAACGYAAVRAVAPGLYSSAPMALPFLGGTRLPAARRRATLIPTTPLPH